MEESSLSDMKDEINIRGKTVNWRIVAQAEGTEAASAELLASRMPSRRISGGSWSPSQTWTTKESAGSAEVGRL